MTDTLFTPLQLGALPLKNRVVMAPLTRCRATGNVPNALMAEYYSARAGAGLIISEGTSPSPNGLGYARIPGLFREDQVTGWQGVTGAVHAAGGRMFAQLMHTGRVSHPANLPRGARVLAPSAVAAPGKMWTDAEGLQPFPVPEVMSEQDISHALAEYAAEDADVTWRLHRVLKPRLPEEGGTRSYVRVDRPLENLLRSLQVTLIHQLR